MWGLRDCTWHNRIPNAPLTVHSRKLTAFPLLLFFQSYGNNYRKQTALLTDTLPRVSAYETGGLLWKVIGIENFFCFSFSLLNFILIFHWFYFIIKFSIFFLECFRLFEVNGLTRRPLVWTYLKTTSFPCKPFSFRDNSYSNSEQTLRRFICC